MKFSLQLAITCAVLPHLTACGLLFGEDGTFRDRSNDYRKATVESPLQLPEGIDSDAIGDGYAIPPISDRTSLDAKFEIPKPDPLADDLNQGSVRINTLDTQRWILVDGSPGQIWPRLRGFLNLNQLTVQRADAVSGIIETGWLQPSGEDQLRERYRLRIDQGVQRGTSEVYVLQADIRAGTDNWPQQSSNDERATIMTKELAQYLADSSAAAAVSMLAQQAIDSSGKITLEEDDQSQVFIRLSLPFSRAWASVGRSLEKAGYHVDDLNRSEQTYFVHYQEKHQRDKKKGFISRLFSWGGSDKKSDKGTPYLVKLSQQSNDTVIITIERQSGEAMAKSESEQLLKLIKRHMA